MKHRFGDRKKRITIFCIAVLIHWILAWLAYCSYYKTSGSAVFSVSHIFQRLSQAGDAEHYLYLAGYGYQSTGEKANLIVFYPLYPLLVGLIGRFPLMGNFVPAGLLISNVCTGIAAVYLYQLIRLDFEEENAQAGVMAFLLYPFMIFSMGIYTEGLFLMLTATGLYHIRNHRWMLAGIVGFLAALTRIHGMLLLAPAVYEYIRCKMLDGKKWKEYVRWQDLFLLGMPGGSLLYLCLNKVLQNDFFSFIAHQEAPPWYQSIKWMNANLSKDYDMALNYGALAYFIYWVQILLFFIAIGVLLYGIKKKILTCYIVYGGVYICLTYLAGWMISGGRYMMGCIPLYIVFAAVENRRARSFLLCAVSALCMFYTILFMQGQAIM